MIKVTTKSSALKSSANANSVFAPINLMSMMSALSIGVGLEVDGVVCPHATNIVMIAMRSNKMNTAFLII